MVERRDVSGSTPASVGLGRHLSTGWRVLVGRPLRASEEAKERITPVEGLSALSLDALTSVAYGPEAILVTLAVAGAGALHLALPILLAIVGLLAILVFSYRQVIDAYPGGGGAYAVSLDNFGTAVSRVAAGSLIVDYTLTVAVSIAAGIGALTSAYPSLSGSTVPLCLGVLALITVLNLRGLGEGARAFLFPTMVFIVGLLAVIAVGLVHPLALGTTPTGRSLVAAGSTAETVGVLLVLKAFAAGCSALTGVEAIANGVPLFKEPRQRRAKRTEMLLGVILGVMLVGLGVLGRRFHVQPRSGQTVLSQIMSIAVGRHWAYYVVSIAVTVVLALAANTSFGGLPVLASLLARDNQVPHAFALRGDRQVYSKGIWVLAVMSGTLLLVSRGNTQSLIPLFAIGVFIGFTLAQAGLVVHWRRLRPPGWRRRAALNGLGACTTAIATVIFLVTKFTSGAWVVVVAVPLFVLVFDRVEGYYRRLGKALGLGALPPVPEAVRTLVVVPVVSVSRLTEKALSEALSLGDEVIAVTVQFDTPTEATAQGPDQGADDAGRGGTGGRPGALPSGGHPAGPDQLQRDWARWHPGVALRVLRTEYASVVRPIVRFIDDLRATRDDQIVVLIPVVEPERARYRLLHNQLDLALSSALRRRTDLVVARIPMRVSELAAPTSAPQDGTAADD